MYTAYRQAGGTPKRLIGSGNGLRQNRYLQQRFETAFGCPLTLSDGREKAPQARHSSLRSNDLTTARLLNKSYHQYFEFRTLVLHE